MYLAVHAASGMLAGALLKNPAAAFAAGFIAHFLLDMVPHENKNDIITDYPKSKMPETGTLKRRSIISSTDLIIVLGITVWSWIISGHAADKAAVFIPIFFGIAGGIMPDVIVMLAFFLDNPFLRWYFRLHNELHFFISSVSVPYPVSLTYQGALTVAMVSAASVMI